MKAAGLAFLCAIAGYGVGVLLGIGMVKLFSTPKPDKSMEAVMTGFFFVGPVVAVVTFVAALLYLRSRQGGP